jgi:hypothetical protein
VSLSKDVKNGCSISDSSTPRCPASSRVSCSRRGSSCLLTSGNILCSNQASNSLLVIPCGSFPSLVCTRRIKLLFHFDQPRTFAESDASRTGHGTGECGGIEPRRTTQREQQPVADERDVRARRATGGRQRSAASEPTDSTPLQMAQAVEVREGGSSTRSPPYRYTKEHPGGVYPENWQCPVRWAVVPRSAPRARPCPSPALSQPVRPRDDCWHARTASACCTCRMPGKLHGKCACSRRWRQRCHVQHVCVPLPQPAS